jgi:hypothetical protein
MLPVTTQGHPITLSLCPSKVWSFLPLAAFRCPAEGKALAEEALTALSALDSRPFLLSGVSFLGIWLHKLLG